MVTYVVDSSSSCKQTREITSTLASWFEHYHVSISTGEHVCKVTRVVDMSSPNRQTKEITVTVSHSGVFTSAIPTENHLCKVTDAVDISSSQQSDHGDHCNSE